MPRFVRCIEGHVFDAEAAAQCPVCGAVFEAKPPASTAATSPPLATSATAGVPNRSLIVAIVITVLGIGLGAGALVYVLRGSAPATTTASNTSTPAAEKSKERTTDTASAHPSPTPSAAPATTSAENAPASPAEKAKEKSGADTAPRPASPTTPAAITAAPNAPAPAPTSSPANTVSAPKVASLPNPGQTPATPSPPATPSMSVSDTLRTTLDVARMLVAFRQKKYDDALSQAGLLADLNNPIAMFVKAGILQNGLTGNQDSVQARDLLAKAAQLGDPTSQLFYAKMLEQGIGGAADPEKAKQLYLLASRGMASAADQDVTRLRLDGARGMTALEAYQNLTGQNPNASAISVLNNLYKVRSTAAVCLSGWLALQSRTRGWVATAGNTEEFVGRTPEEVKRLQATALTEDQVKAHSLQDFEFGAVRSDPWCEWGMATLAAEGVSGYPKNQVEADVFYRLAAANRRLGSSSEQVKQQMADLESKMSVAEKAQADGLLHSAVPSSVAP